MDDAAYIYARACRAWYGQKATDVVRSKLAQMKANGDQAGVAVWEKVEQEITEITDGQKTRKSGSERSAH